ncbi:MAG: type II secretory pathway pseudopilin PulG [Planctomycetota bacterium]|jgi:type II secretory pathway pseudopilin PulG
MKTKFHTIRPKKGGFSAVELVLTVLVLAILMGVVKMRSSNLLDRSKITKIAQTAAVAKSACILFHTDTAQYAKHDMVGYPLLESQLPGWNGPYLKGAELKQSNPFGDFRIDNNHTGFGKVTGWDLDNDGNEEVTGACNVILLTGIDEQTANKLNTYYDPAKTEAWEKAGRFQYVPACQSGLIFLHQ